MKKALLIGIIGFAVLSLGIAVKASAYETWDPCFYYGCFEPESGIFNTNINDNFSWNDNLNNNINNISINNGFGGGSNGGGSNYDAPQCDDGYDNDSDGRIDYPYDRGCSSRTDNSENSDDNNNNDDEPEVTTRDASSISETSATLNGRVDGNGSNTRVWFEYSDDRGDIAGDEETNEDSVGSGTTSFDDRITGLRRNTTYYFRAVAENSEGTDYGSISSFHTDDDGGNDDNDDAQCDDDRDNDNDGDKDYPEDAGCSSRSDNSENSERTISSGSAPYFTSTPANTVQAGQIYSYNADAISPNGRDITYSLAVKPAGMTINSSTGLIQWSVPASLGNSYQGALVVAADTAGNQATQSYIISIRSGVVVLPPPSNPPVNNPPANNPPAQQELRIVGVRAREVDGSVIVSFGTNISARGSVRYGGASQADQDSDFTYLSSQLSENGQGTTHRVNLGALAIGQTYYIRAFATVGTRSTFSSEIAFTHREPTEPTEAAPAATAEVVGTDSCFDGIDNDKDGVADAADSDCEAEGQVAGTFASALESFGAFLISPWFLILVIIILIVYIIIARRNREIVSTTGPIEIKS